jgi:hypothetical protein
MLFFNQNIPDEKIQELELYLEYGRGVLEVSGLDTNTIASPIYREMFGLEWLDESLPLTSYDSGFYETEPGKSNYNIMKYFQHLPFRAGLSQDSPPGGVTSCTGSYASGPFTFRDNTYTLWAIDNSSSGCELSLYIDIDNNNILETNEGPFSEGETVILDSYEFRVKSIEWNHTDIAFQESEYEFSFSGLRETVYPRDNASEKILLYRENAVYPDGRSVPVSVVNYNIVNGRGRTAWLSNSTAQGLESDIKQLLKSLIVWTSGEEYQIIRGLEKTDPVTLYFYKALDQDMFQPIELALTLGYRQ